MGKWSDNPEQAENVWELHAGEPPEDGWRASEKRRREFADAHRDEIFDYSQPATAIAPWTGPKRIDDSSRDSLD